MKHKKRMKAKNTFILFLCLNQAKKTNACAKCNLLDLRY